MVRAPAALLLALILSNPTHQTDPPQETPVFRAGVTFIEVGAIVTGPDGRFVGGLSQDDFQILEDGVPQDLASFRVVLIPQQAEAEAETVPVASDIRTNAEVGEGRLFVLVLDDLHTAPERSSRVREVAREFIEKWVGGGDLVAVTHTSGRTDVSVEFTDNRKVLMEAVDGFMGRGLRSMTLERIELRRQLLDDVVDNEVVAARLRSLDSEHGFQARNALSSLRSIGEALASIRGRKKTILFFSEGISYDIQDFTKSTQGETVVSGTRAAIGSTGLSNVSIYAVDVRGLGAGLDELVLVPETPTPGDTRESSAAATNPVDREVGELLSDTNLGSRSFAEEARRGRESLRVLSSETGGFAVVQTNDLGEGLSRISRDSSRYYLLGFYPANPEADGRFRQIEVRVKRPGLTVRARKGYIIPESDSRRADGGDVSDPLAKIMASPTPVSGLPLRVYAAPYHIGAERSSVAVVVETDVQDFRFTEEEAKYHDEVDISVMALDHQGAAVFSRANKYNLSLRPEVREQMLQDGFRTLSVLDLVPGSYQIRIGALESGAGLRGSVFYDLDVPARSAEAAVMSGLIVSSTEEEAVPAASTNEASERVTLRPSTRRTFDYRDEILAYIEIYGLASPLQVETLVKDGEGKTVFESTESRVGDETDLIVQKRIALSDFPPGRYVLEVRVHEPGGAVQAQRRTGFEVIGTSVAADLFPGDLLYSEPMNAYLRGEPEGARSSLLRWDDDAIQRAVKQLESGAPETNTVKAAILLHTEVVAFHALDMTVEAQAHHFEAAEKLLDLIPEEKAFERDWLLSVACWYNGMDLSESTEYLKKAMKLFPHDAEILLAAGSTHEASVWVDDNRGGLNDAEKLYRQAVAADPELAEAHLRLGRILQQRGDKRGEEAGRELKWVTDNSEDSYLLYLAHLFLGDLHKTERRIDEAVASYRAAVRAAPQWQVAYLSLSQALRASGNRGDARDVAREALELPVSDPEYVDGYRIYHLGQLNRVPELLERMRREVVQ